MVLVLGLRRQEEALEMQKAVTDATNEMLRQTSAMMKNQAIAIEEQSQRGIIDVETLEQANRDLIAVSYTHLDVYKRQFFDCASECQNLRYFWFK